MTIFLRLLADKNKERTLLNACSSLRNGLENQRFFTLSPESFRTVPGAPFAYWVSDSVRSAFKRLPQISSYGIEGKVGVQTSSNFRFLRIWWERHDGVLGGWVPYGKGGGYSEFYGEIYLIVLAENNFDEIVAYANGAYPYLNGKARSLMHAEKENFGQIGITWTKSTTSKPSFRFLPAGASYSDTGPTAGGASANEFVLLALAAAMNSSSYKFLLTLSLGLAAEGRKHYEIGVVNKNPIPMIDGPRQATLGRLAGRAWSLKRSLFSTEETSYSFELPAALRARLGFFEPLAIEAELERIHAEIDAIALDLYRFSAADLTTLQDGQGSANEIDNRIRADDESDDDDDDDDDVAVDQVAGLLSWAVGVAFGRFDWRLATGERTAPVEPNPFDPLPAKSPGMLPDGGAPFYAHAGILVDDPGHAHDLVRIAERVLERVDMPVPADLRRWLQKDFFPFHLQRYSKSRRKAPIYWPLSTASGSYTLWLYYPSLTSQTLYTAIIDFVEPKLVDVVKEAGPLKAKGSARTQDEEKRLETLASLEAELTDLRDQLQAIAPQYQLDHDDGVQVTAAPLWPLFRHKPWQKLLKVTWAKLQKGDYDWAHLAMNYWPERVREKCKTDKSLAIAHGLEELYVEPEAALKKTRGRKKAGSDE
ncbi:MAG: hypothetical protein K0M67_21435 [Thiobacillus sp.]|nr:hypothetical protein [Thiobacillus sp.]